MKKPSHDRNAQRRATHKARTGQGRKAQLEEYRASLMHVVSSGRRTREKRQILSRHLAKASGRRRDIVYECLGALDASVRIPLGTR